MNSEDDSDAENEDEPADDSNFDFLDMALADVRAVQCSSSKIRSGSSPPSPSLGHTF